MLLQSNPDWASSQSDFEDEGVEMQPSVYDEGELEAEKRLKVVAEQGCGIRKHPRYPGVRCGKLTKGTVVIYSAKTVIQHNDYSIKFYKLADGRGWVHGFNSRLPSAPSGLQEIETIMMCPRNHANIISEAMSFLVCNRCHQTLRPGMQKFSCPECNWDCCTTCFKKENCLTVIFEPRNMGFLHQGNLVTEIIAESQAAAMDVCVGSIIVSVNGEDQPNDTMAIINAVKETRSLHKSTMITFKLRKLTKGESARRQKERSSKMAAEFISKVEKKSA